MRSIVIDFLARDIKPLERLAAWFVALAAIAALGFLRTASDAEYAFASAAIIPVVAVAWIGGRKAGMLLSMLAAIMWASSDLLAERQFSSWWIPYLNAITRLATYAFITHLVVMARTLLAREREIASHDALTGLLNRRAFFEAGNSEADRSRRYGHPLAVAFLDLDNFKRLNDSQGHEAGDRALKAVAKCLVGSLRTTDRLARLGGDEFAVLLPEIGYDAATDAGHKIAAAADAALKEFPPVSASIGIAWFERAVGDFPAMLDAADSLMYEIKQEGKHGMRVERLELPEPDRSPTDTP
jgi:diguanylate cyclase (GGDEF)-like protein